MLPATDMQYKGHSDIYVACKWYAMLQYLLVRSQVSVVMVTSPNFSHNIDISIVTL